MLPISATADNDPERHHDEPVLTPPELLHLRRPIDLQNGLPVAHKILQSAQKRREHHAVAQYRPAHARNFCLVLHRCQKSNRRLFTHRGVTRRFPKRLTR